MSVPAMRRVLGDTLRRLGINEDSVADILLAASEACANVVRHAGNSVTDYEVAATVDTAGCRVEIIDTGTGYAPSSDPGPADVTLPGGTRAGARGAQATRPRRRRAAAPDVTTLAESGRGFEVMRACVDGVTLRTAPGRGTIVTLDKRIRWDDRARSCAPPPAPGQPCPGTQVA